MWLSGCDLWHLTQASFQALGLASSRSIVPSRRHVHVDACSLDPMHRLSLEWLVTRSRLRLHGQSFTTNDFIFPCFAFILCSVLEAASHPFIVLLFEERLICLTLLKPPFGVLSRERWSTSSFVEVVDYNKFWDKDKDKDKDDKLTQVASAWWRTRRTTTSS